MQLWTSISSSVIVIVPLLPRLDKSDNKSSNLVKVRYSNACVRPVAHSAKAYPDFCSMKVPRGRDASRFTSTELLPALYSLCAFIHLGRERHCESKVS